MESDGSAWFPPWKIPLLWSEWQQIEYQALLFRKLTEETYDTAKSMNMPHWFIEQVARNRYRAKRRHIRVKCANAARKYNGMLRLLDLIGVGDNE